MSGYKHLIVLAERECKKDNYLQKLKYTIIQKVYNGPTYTNTLFCNGNLLNRGLGRKILPQGVVYPWQRWGLGKHSPKNIPFSTCPIGKENYVMNLWDNQDMGWAYGFKSIGGNDHKNSVSSFKGRGHYHHITTSYLSKEDFLCTLVSLEGWGRIYQLRENHTLSVKGWPLK